MKIEKFGALSNDRKEVVLPEIVNRVFAICKNDSRFPLKIKIEEVESEILNLNEKIKKQESLIEKSKNIRRDLDKRKNILEAYNYELREKILESLGSEM